MATVQPRAWLTHLNKIYNPAKNHHDGAVLLLDGHHDDLFYFDVAQPAIPLYQRLYEQFRHNVDAFVWYQHRGVGQLTYEFNRFPTADGPTTPQPARPPTDDDLLGLTELEADAANWQQVNQGRAIRACTPQEAIREIDALLKTPGHRAVVVFQNVNWAINENDLLAYLGHWPELCQAHHHLVVFGLSNPDLNWLRIFGQPKAKGVTRLTLEGPTPAEIKAFLIYYHLCHNYPLFDWLLLDDIAARMAETMGADLAQGYKTISQQFVPNVAQSGVMFDADWLAKQPGVGQKAQEVYLVDIVLKPAERAFFEDLLQHLRDPERRRKEAERLRISENKIYVPNRILLYGPPGTGKTTIGKMVATESKRRFYSVKAADFQSTYRGGPVEKVAQHFAEWRRNAPCVVFWDEVESIAGDRAHSQHDDNPITQILAELDSTGGRDDELVIICATNLPEKLDPAFRERFPTPFLIGYPDANGRQQLVTLYFAAHLFEPGLTIPEAGKMLEDRSGREIKACAEACLNQLSIRQEQTITRQMIQAWLGANPLKQQTIQYWQQREAEQERDLRERGSFNG